VIQRDYIDRLIQECAQALSRMLGLRRAGRHDEALQVFDEAADRILGPIRPLLERMEPESAVDFVGPNQLDRLRLYAALLGQEGLVHRARGDSARAFLSCRRALELYAAISVAGGALVDDDVERIGVLTTVVDVRALEPRCRDELARLSRPQG
jgi:tetratricopeptide (TPR) repeat protein